MGEEMGVQRVWVFGKIAEPELLLHKSLGEEGKEERKNRGERRKEEVRV